ncbi:MAG: HIRAN domain-containing protein [Elusimicrobiota bacterium]|nr:HIRAN domain-containing protein [Elusimicrobiota bacterium]
MSKFKIIYSTTTHIAGTRHESSDGRSRRYYVKKLNPGEKLILEREPDNPKDKNAVKVLNKERKLLGYIPRTIVRQMADYMDKGEKAAAVVKEVDYQPGTACRCDIKAAIFRVKEEGE